MSKDTPATWHEFCRDVLDCFTHICIEATVQNNYLGWYWNLAETRGMKIALYHTASPFYQKVYDLSYAFEAMWYEAHIGRKHHD